MRREFWYPSCGAGQIHAFSWTPEGEPRAIVQLVHGIADFAQRYDEFARYLNSRGFLVVAEDHMGHGGSIEGGSIQGYFHGGWFAGVEDTVTLARNAMAEYPELPYILFGHSMGSFMTRTILCKYPDLPLKAAVICGTGWQPTAALPGLARVVDVVCKRQGETTPSELLQNLVFGSYNRGVEHPRTSFDWISRDAKIVDAFIAHPHSGFTASCGLLREMMKGMYYIQRRNNLENMDKALPIFFVAGGDDPVGNYGKGVRRAARAFQEAGMQRVSTRIYPLCRHEILNEINRAEIYEEIARWMINQL